MPSEWDVVEEKPIAGGEWDVVEEKPSYKIPSPKPPSKGFLGGVAEMLPSIPGMWRQAEQLTESQKRGELGITDRLKMLAPAFGMAPAIPAQVEQGSKAVAALQSPGPLKHRVTEATGYGLAAVTPLVGPMAADIGERIVEGEYARATGNLVGLAAPKALSLGKTKIQPKPQLTAAEESAVKFGERSNIPIDAATASGSEFAQGTKALLSKQPLSAGIVGKTQQAQQEALATTGQGLARSVAPKASGDKFAAGESVVTRLKDRITKFNDEADAAYGEARKLAAEHTQSVQQGQKVHPTEPIRSGQQNLIPVMEDVSVPVDITVVKAKLRPLFESISKQMDEAQKQASPGFKALSEIMGRPKYVSLDTALADESAIQTLTRTSKQYGQVEHAAMRDASKGIASAIVPVYRQAIDAVAKSTNPAILDALNRGRAATKQKHDAIRFLKRDLGMAAKEPTRVIRRLAANDDASANMLATLKTMEPDVLPDIGRSVLEGILRPSTSGSGYGKARSAQNNWNRLGPKTKEMLFGNQVKDIDDYFQLGKMLTDNPNPSGSATVGSIMATGMYTLAHPLTAVPIILGQRKIARVLMSPNGPALLRQGIDIPITSPLAKPTALSILSAAGMEENQEKP